MSNDIENVSARLAIADAVLAAIKESGLLRAKRRVIKRRRRRKTAVASTATAPKAKATAKTRTSRNPLKNVPAEVAA